MFFVTGVHCNRATYGQQLMSPIMNRRRKLSNRRQLHDTFIVSILCVFDNMKRVSFNVVVIFRFCCFPSFAHTETVNFMGRRYTSRYRVYF
jgi:hypothetical protein